MKTIYRMRFVALMALLLVLAACGKTKQTPERESRTSSKVSETVKKEDTEVKPESMASKTKSTTEGSVVKPTDTASEAEPTKAAAEVLCEFGEPTIHIWLDDSGEYLKKSNICQIQMSVTNVSDQYIFFPKLEFTIRDKEGKVVHTLLNSHNVAPFYLAPGQTGYSCDSYKEGGDVADFACFQGDYKISIESEPMKVDRPFDVLEVQNISWEADDRIAHLMRFTGDVTNTTDHDVDIGQVSLLFYDKEGKFLFSAYDLCDAMKVGETAPVDTGTRLFYNDWDWMNRIDHCEGFAIVEKAVSGGE